jgi:hypothetical protein
VSLSQRESVSSGSFPAAVLDVGGLLEDERAEVQRARDLLAQGRAGEASRSVERVMNRAAGRAQPDVLHAYAHYLLARGRPFSAGRALRPLLRRRPVEPETRVLYAETLADAGDVQRSLELAETLANSGGEGAVAAAKLFDELHRLGAHEEHPDAEVVRRRLGELTGREPAQLLEPGALPQLDERLRDWSVMGSLAHSPAADLWGYCLGEYLRRHLGATWSWRRRLEASTVRVPVGTGTVELLPTVWARWALEGSDHRLAHVVRALLLLQGARRERLESLLGASLEEDPGALAERDPLSAALAEATRRQACGERVTGLGLAADCPFGRVRAPLVVEDTDGPKLVVQCSPSGEEGDFERYLDMLCLGPFGRNRWTVASVNPAHRAYERPDAGRRAALVARRLCSEDNAQNARWAVTVAGNLLETTLDGRLSSLSKVERLVTDELRQGGIERWGELFEERFAMLFLLTCYTGEVVRRHYGGEWGADRLTGEPTGPTAGLELGGVRFNLGAVLLRTFYGGPSRSMLPAVREYARRAGSRQVSAEFETAGTSRAKE